MYRRNLDIAVAAIVAILGGLAAAAKLPGTATIPLGIGLFFAPGYLWSEAIISQRLTGFERALASAGMAFIFPILGGFLFYGLHIQLFKSAWIGLLVVLTLLGVVAVAIQRLRGAPVDQRRQQYQRQQQGNQPARPGGRLSVLHAFIFGLAAVIGLGAVAFSVKSAEAQKFHGFTMFSMPTIVPGKQSYVGNANSAGNPAADTSKATQATLMATNDEGVTEQYRVILTKTVTFPNPKGPSKKTVTTSTWNFTLANGQTWQTTIPYAQTANTTQVYQLVANLYLLPDVKTPYRTVNNGQ
jgi:hypothetical protein